MQLEPPDASLNTGAAVAALAHVSVHRECVGDATAQRYQDTIEAIWMRI